MAIARNPNRTLDAAEKEKRELAFITKTEATVEAHAPQQSIDQNKKPTMIRIDPDLLIRIDRAAKRLGISRSAFIVSSTAEKLERME
jgi:hypothetical protein